MSKKKQYQNGGKFTPKNAAKKTAMSEKKKNILAYILAFFMIVWTACSVLGVIGFVKSSAEEETITIPRNYVRSDNSYGIMLDGFNRASWYDNAGDYPSSCVDTFFFEVDNHGEYVKIHGVTYTFDVLRTNQMSISTTIPVNVQSVYDYYEYNFRLTLDFTHMNLFGVAPTVIEYEKPLENELVCYIMYDNGDYISIFLSGLSSSSAYVNSSVFGYNGIYLPVDQYIVRQEILYYSLDQAGGYNAGYEEGYSAGRSDGYGVGYTDGVNEANDYTFFSLISSVIDVPVQTFINLLNFDLLGVNMADFGLSLLTVCIIIAVIKLFI